MVPQPILLKGVVRVSRPWNYQHPIVGSMFLVGTVLSCWSERPKFSLAPILQ